MSKEAAIDADLRAFKARWDPFGVVLQIHREERSNLVHLGKIVIEKDRRGEGLGTSVMKDLIGLADKHGFFVTLSPSTDFGGTSVRRLEGFYKKFDFKKNKGRDKDFTISATMIRPTKKLL